MTESSDKVISTKRYLDIMQVADMLGVGKCTVYGLMQRREIPFSKIGKRIYRFDPDKIQEWIQGRATKSLQECGLE